MNIKVEMTWLENNKSGRSAYYQIFILTKNDGQKVSVTHWGKNTSKVKIWHRPILGGEVSVVYGITDKENQKILRGYEVIDRSKESHPLKWLVETFGATDAEKIRSFLNLSDPNETTDNEVIEKAAIEDIPEEPLPAMWGAW